MRVGEPKPAGIDDVLPPERLADLLAVSDIVVLAAPHTSSTDRLIGARELARMKRGALVVNIVAIIGAVLAVAKLVGH